MTAIVRFLAVASTMCLFALAPATSQPPIPTPGSGTAAKPKPFGGEWEVHYIDDSAMKLSLLDEHVTLNTSYGPLQMPLREIRRIEFGVRLSDAEQAKCEKAISEILGKDSAKREQGKEAILELGTKILPFLRRVLKSADADAVPHLDQVAMKLQSQLPNQKVEPRDYDLVITDDSRIAGRIQAPALRIQTFQFGELKLKVTDIASLNQGPSVTDEKLEIVEGKRVYDLLQTHMGKTVGIRVTGAIQGAVWGSSPFTGDSDLPTAAVFMGVLKVGQTGIVKIKLVPSPPTFVGSTANGVSTNGYQQYPAGAYEIIVK
jgi:hypothetical protein